MMDWLGRMLGRRKTTEATEATEATKAVEASTLRSLIAHATWHIPAAMGEQGPKMAFTADTLSIYDSSEGLGAANLAATGTQEGLFLTMDGRGLFGQALRGHALTSLTIHREGQDPMNLGPEDLVRATIMADGMTIDDVLLGRSNAADGFTKMRTFQHFKVPGREHEGRFGLMMAPDAKGRKLAAIFTTEDAAQAFVTAVESELSMTPVMKTMDGHALFSMLAGVQLDGLVFNCKGPDAPKAVAPQFAAVVLNA
ncbi:MAG: hypothetical protein ACON5B_13690 [Myxococcota bacterium]